MEETHQEKILKKFKALKAEAEKDCFFSKENMEQGFDNTNSIIKWINKKSDWNAVFRTYEAKRKTTYRSVYEFYLTDYPHKLNSKDEYQLFIESDTSYNDIYNLCLQVKEVIVYIDAVLDTLKGRAFLLKNALDWHKFCNGQ
jgi:biotin synthase-like enzyme